MAPGMLLEVCVCLGALILQPHVQCLATGELTGVYTILMPDNWTVGEIFYSWNSTWNCSIALVPEKQPKCGFFEINGTDMMLKTDLLSDCSIGGVCSFTCGAVVPSFTIIFQRMFLDLYPMEFIQNKSYVFHIPESAGQDHAIYKFEPSDIVRTDCYYYGVQPKFSVQTRQDVFSIDEFGSETGILHLKKKLDYETQESYNVTVRANVYNKTATIQVTVIVVDVDDMDPEFIGTPYALNITENDTSSINMCLQATPPIGADDRDQGAGRQNLTFSIIKGADDLFQIDGETGCINVSRVIDWTKESTNQYHITVKATQDNDPRRYATAMLTVRIIDTNNHRPKFKYSRYSTEVDEHSRSGTFVIQVVATDADEGKFANTTYKLISNDGRFTIESNTGIIRVDNSTTLDRESVPNGVQLQVQAIDGEADEVGDTTIVNVTLIDINDNTPEFTLPEYMFWISSGTDTENVRATDDDLGENGRVSYDVETPTSGVSINSINGTITFTSVLNHLEFYVRACDHPTITNSKRCSYAKVSVYVNRTVDTEGTSKNMSVPENSPAGTIVGHIDLPSASIIDEKMPFIIESDLVRTSSVLDREKTPSYTFIVMTVGQVIINITVHVLDTNDNLPVFSHAEYMFGFPVSGALVGSVKATDADSGENGNVSYGLQHSFAAHKYFKIDTESGDVTLSGSEIPHDQTSFQVAALAYDNGNPRMQSSCAVYISRITAEGNYTVSIRTPLTPGELNSRKASLERTISEILNLTIKASIPKTFVKRDTASLTTKSVLEITATYSNGTRVLANDLQRYVLLHLSEIEALFAVDMSRTKGTSVDSSNVTEIALIVVAAVILLGSLIAVIFLSIKWRALKAHKKIMRLDVNLTRRSSLYESQEIKVRMDDETSDYNGSLNTLDTYDAGVQPPTSELTSFHNDAVYGGGEGEETTVKSVLAYNEALLSLRDLSDRLNEEDPMAPTLVTNSESQRNSLDTDPMSESATAGRHTHDTADNVKQAQRNPYDNIEFNDDFPSASGFAGLKIDGKMISSTGKGHENDIMIVQNEEKSEHVYQNAEMIDDNEHAYQNAEMIDDNEHAYQNVVMTDDSNIENDEPDIDYHLKEVRFANRVVNADTNIAEDLKLDKSENKKTLDNKPEDNKSISFDDDDEDDDKIFLVNMDTNHEYDNEEDDLQVDNADASIRMDEEINSPVDFLKYEEEYGEDTGTFVFSEQITAL